MVNLDNLRVATLNGSQWFINFTKGSTDYIIRQNYTDSDLLEIYSISDVNVFEFICDLPGKRACVTADGAGIYVGGYSYETGLVYYSFDGSSVTELGDCGFDTNVFALYFDATTNAALVFYAVPSGSPAPLNWRGKLGGFRYNSSSTPKVQSLGTHYDFFGTTYAATEAGAITRSANGYVYVNTSFVNAFSYDGSTWSLLRVSYQDDSYITGVTYRPNISVVSDGSSDEIFSGPLLQVWPKPGGLPYTEPYGTYGIGSYVFNGTNFSWKGRYYERLPGGYFFACAPIRGLDKTYYFVSYDQDGALGKSNNLTCLVYDESVSYLYKLFGEDSREDGAVMVVEFNNKLYVQHLGGDLSVYDISGFYRGNDLSLSWIPGIQ